MSPQKLIAPMWVWPKSGLKIDQPVPTAIAPIPREAVGVAWECAQVDILRTQAKQPIRVCRINRCLLRKCNVRRSFCLMQNGPMQRKSVGSPYKQLSADHALMFSSAVWRLEDWLGPLPLLQGPARRYCRLQDSPVPVLRLREPPEQLRVPYSS